MLVFTTARAEDAVVSHRVEGGDFRSVHDALVEVIEAEGMVIGAVLPFAHMLERTIDRDRQKSPYREAEIVQFCSAVLAYQMVTEDAGQLVNCPLSIAIYVRVDEADVVVMAARLPQGDSPAKQSARVLLGRLITRAVSLSK